MSDQVVRYTAEEITKRGGEIYEREVRALVESAHRGKVVAIDVDRGNYVIDGSALAASRPILEARPDAQLYFVRVGSPVFAKIGGAMQRGRE